MFLSSKGRAGLDDAGSVRNSFHYLVRHHRAVKLSRGRFGPINAETPVSAGVSGGERPSDGLSLQEGGSAHGAVPPDGRGGGSDNTGLRHGHSDRASVMEVLSLADPLVCHPKRWQASGHSFVAGRRLARVEVLET